MPFGIMPDLVFGFAGIPIEPPGLDQQKLWLFPLP
jgi:hypothetical protein